MQTIGELICVTEWTVSNETHVFVYSTILQTGKMQYHKQVRFKCSET